MILAGAKHGHATSSPIVKEAKSYLCAIKSAFEFGAHNVIIEGDCLLLIRSRQIHDTFVGSLVRDVLSFIEHFDFISWFFVKRDDNEVAYDLAHKQPSCPVVWKSAVSKDILSWDSDDMHAYVNNHLI